MRIFLPITLTAAIITFSLFAFMAFLINKNESMPLVVDNTIPFDVIQTPPAQKVAHIVRVKPTPPPQSKPPKTVVEPRQNNLKNTMIYNRENIKMPKIKKTLKNSAQLTNSAARAMVQITPKYPISALNKGIEGWVKLAFNINELGEVFGIKVLDSKPKRTFDKAARQALRKWKYRAKTVNGTAIEQYNLTVQLDFKKDNTQG